MQRCLIDLPENFRKTMAMKEGELIKLGLRKCACEDWECEFCVCPIFEFIFGLKPLHIHIYFYTLNQKRTIKEISNRVSRDRTTVVRLVQSLIEHGLINKESEILPTGGLRHIYSAIPQELLKEKLKESFTELGFIVEEILKQDWSQVRDRKEDVIV
ncbi:MAG: helix-turn-helix domain-containing protein [Candidatus Thorarchaeota archaeon]